MLCREVRFGRGRAARRSRRVTWSATRPLLTLPGCAALLDIAKVVGAINKFEDLIELTAEEARRALDASSLSVSRWDRERGRASASWSTSGCSAPTRSASRPTRSTPSGAYPQVARAHRARRGYVSDVDDGTAEAELLAALEQGLRASASRSWSTRGSGARSTRPGPPASGGSPRPTSTSASRWPPRSRPASCRPTTSRASNGWPSRTR